MTTQTFTINQPSPLTISGTVTNGSCASPGSICVTATGGSAPFSFTWSNGATTQCITGLPSGVYSLTLTDANGCTGAQSFTVTGNSFSSVNQASCLGCTGSISIFNPGANFNWSTGDTVSSIQNLCPGIYYLTVTDTSGTCLDTFNITQQLLSVVVNANSGTCSSIGYACASVTGATFPVTYLWSNSSTAQCVQSLTPGSYSLTVTDNVGCADTASFTINSNILNVSQTLTHPTCGNSDGSISLSVSGGSGNYTYNWITPLTSTDSFVTGLAPGNYLVHVRDNLSGCADTLQFTLQGTCGTISGHVFDDKNENGIQDSGENGLSGITITLTPGGQSTVTDQNGDYSFGIGTYDTFTVNILPPNRYYCSGTAILPDSITAPAGGSYNVIISQANPTSTGNDFGLHVPDSPCGSISGQVINDINGNGIKDPGEPGKSGVVIRLNSGQLIQTDGSGNYTVEVPLNTPITLTLVPGTSNYYCYGNTPYWQQTFPVSPPVYTVTVTAANPNVTMYDFGVISSPFFDMGIYTIRSFSGIHAGRTFTAWMDFKSSGNVSDTCRLRVNFDPLVNFISANLPPTTVTNTFVEWAFPPGTAPSAFCMFMTFSLDSSATAGTQLIWSGNYSCGSPDACPANDSMSTITTVQTGPVRSMYDNGFNFMEVMHTGDPTGAITHADSVFSYVINFQNTTADTLYHLAIVDTLSPHLNIESISRPFSSHFYKMHMVEPNIVIWEFNNILMPDSTTDYLRSYGFLQYNIHMKPNLPHGTKIEHRAAISFNYREPYLTNETSLIIKQLPPVGIGNVETPSVRIYPNPAQDKLYIESEQALKAIRVYDLCGKLLLEKFSGQTSEEIRLEGWTKGCYLIKLSADGFEEHHRIVKQ